MTIAIGMLYNFGALLCADTQHETYTLKTHETKIGDFSIPGGKIAFAMAGNSRFATSALQKCEKELNARNQPSTIEFIERILDREYRRNVLKHPAYSTDPNIPYWLLLSVWTSIEGLKLYLAWETSLSEVDGFECIGAGQDLAQYTIKPSYYRRMSQEQVQILAANALARAKEFVPGCGGNSEAILMRSSDGRTKTIHPDTIQRQEKRLTDCDASMRTILFQTTNLELEEGRFEACIAGLNGDLRRLREDCRYEKQFLDGVHTNAQQSGAPTDQEWK